MISVAIFTLLVLSAVADVDHHQQYSFIAPTGTGKGISYSLTGQGRITAIRAWEWASSYLVGFQFRYGSEWSQIVGRTEGPAHEMELFDGETVTQISGKYATNIQSVVFTTNMGRSLFVGQSSGHSFNMYPTNRHAELRFISGRYHGAITSIGSHWAIVYPSSNGTMKH